MSITANSVECDFQSFLLTKKLVVVNPKKKNGLIIIKKYHAEFAGPGAIVGGCFDQDLVDAIPVARLSLIEPQNSQERQRAYLIRRQWIKLIKQITDNPASHERAQLILNQFEYGFDADITLNLPDEALALMVGVLPGTITGARDLANRV